MGGRPNHNVFNTKRAKGRVLKNMLSFNKEDNCSIWEMNDRNGGRKDYNKHGEMANYVAFAMDDFGDFICFDKTNNKLVFIDHETHSAEEAASSFTKFINNLNRWSNCILRKGIKKRIKPKSVTVAMIVTDLCLPPVGY